MSAERGRIEAEFDPAAIALGLLVLCFVLLERRMRRASAIAVSVHTVLLCDPAREADLAVRQLRALRRVASELARKRREE